MICPPCLKVEWRPRYPGLRQSPLNSSEFGGHSLAEVLWLQLHEVHLGTRRNTGRTMVLRRTRIWAPRFSC